MRKLGYILVLGLLCSSCGNSENPDTLPTSGAITGSVLLFGEGSASLPPAGMKVSIENSSPPIEATTDNAGKFTLENVPFGTYTLSYEKEGFGTYKKPEIVHEAVISPISITPSLGQLSSTQVIEVRMEKSGSSLITYVTTNPAASINSRRYIRYFFGTTPNVSASNYTAYSETYVVQDTPYYRTFAPSQLSQLGLNPTGTIYMRVYGDSFFSNDYLDPVTKKRVFPNLNPNTVAAKSVTF
ncbi:carboxypeptidase-like regulatory domain-containing protein [Algoriphagus sanaruensis]|uniref:Carboxypeptidase regulatory-like domain-containing protein n=1 Tax=Algoriphagus sanaruensis TaxID=1727163 RepID=A0A142EP70_9BACT|nr:carboxypeptidase-like regulatory domain-containing protein [Algoriphagus sanaruensis]AMQ56925.1 hypothetical protein AO498_10830 [Algoriphagus sanaruensis]